MNDELVSNNNISSIETISVDMEGNVLPISLDYNEYRDDLINIYSTTSEDNSLISEFTVNGNKCTHRLSIKFSDKSSSVEKDKEFQYDDNFINDFLIPMLEDYNKYNPIFNDSVILDSSNLANFTARTKNNDYLIIKGIDKSLASKLSDIIYINDSENPNLVDSVKIKRQINERGIGNILIIVMTIILIAITLIGIIYFIIMTNK